MFTFPGSNMRPKKYMAVPSEDVEVDEIVTEKLRFLRSNNNSRRRRRALIALLIVAVIAVFIVGLSTLWVYHDHRQKSTTTTTTTTVEEAAGAGDCVKPTLRQEWRTLSKKQKEEGSLPLAKSHKSTRLGPLGRFGGDGDINGPITVANGSCVRDGPFANYEVTYANLETQPHCLSRGFGREHSPPHFSGQDFAPGVVQALFAHTTLANFSMVLEETTHDAIPNAIWGGFCFVYGSKW
ncbi:Monooxygenase [Rasamsonia emersonii CBS 393.64]|uniref:Monooxygenase n=1 Tax=Rasamsonia emersonii (strain ATCC 16479 / CBS 393.64 / IMI 116815) TaxID=1408163 RepID=A0A0F4YYL2_RASE3|nr:Monooxygenase [Rasamsonia emersonii CBS 393.64]KKA23387.1 Monooxygenase [Rasamsonia emersonii CBS 393.64]